MAYLCNNVTDVCQYIGLTFALPLVEQHEAAGIWSPLGQPFVQEGHHHWVSANLAGQAVGSTIGACGQAHAVDGILLSSCS